MVLSAIVYSLANIGNIFYSFKYRNQTIKTIYKIVFFLIVFQFATGGIIDTISHQEIRNIPLIFHIVIWCVGFLLFFPTFRANFILGYKNHLTKQVMKKKKIFISYSVVLGIVIILIGIGFFAYRYFISPIISSRMKMPEELNTPKVLVGSDFLLKELFVQDVRLGTITDIALGEFEPGPGPEVGIVGSKGVLFLDENFNVKSLTMFSVNAGHVEIIDVEGDRICEYLDRGGGWQDVSLIDHKGNAIWTYGGMPGVDNICSGDIDGDGLLEFVVGFNGGGGVQLLDRNGKEKWKQPDRNVWHVELVDTNDDGSLEIVHSNAAGQITVRDREGNIISQAKPSPYFSHFSLCRWPNKKSREYALLSENDIIWIFDFDGKVVAQFNAPKCGTLGHARGIPVKLKTDQPEYFAVIVEFSNWKRSILYVYNESGTLVYQEIFTESCASIAAVSIDKSNVESILVGGVGKVWQYK